MSNWQQIKLGEVLKESKVLSTEPNSKKRIRVKLNIGGIEKRPDTNDTEGGTKYYIRKAGQFIYGKQNMHKGAFGIVPIELDGFESSQDIPAFDIHESCYPEWIFYFFKQGNFYLKLESLAKGVGSKRIQPSQLYSLNLLLPPKEEQLKILDSIHAFEEKTMILAAEIKEQLDLVEKLNDVTLNDAIEGKLTETWRKNNPHQEHAKILLQSFKKEKERLISQKIISKETPVPEVKSNEFPYQIPDTWIWCRMADISVKLGAGSTPTGGRSVYSNNGIKFFRSQNIHNDGIRTDDIVYINDSIHSKMKGTHVKPKDILLNITGGSIGRCALIPDNFDEGNVSQHVAIIRLINLELIEYIHNLILSPYFQETIMNVQVGVSREGLSMASLKMIKIPLPPLEEIKVIVKTINELKITHIALKELALNRRKEMDSLNQSALREAFGDINIDLENMAKNKSKSSSGSFHPDIVNTLGNYQKTDVQEIEDLLKKHGKMSALSLWKMSKHEENIDKFYEDLKIKIDKTIKESNEKGFLELVK